MGTEESGEGDAPGLSRAVVLGLGVGDGVLRIVGVAVGVASGLAEGFGVGVGVATIFFTRGLIATPAFHTLFFPDFTQVNFLELDTIVFPRVGQLFPSSEAKAAVGKTTAAESHAHSNKTPNH